MFDRVLIHLWTNQTNFISCWDTINKISVFFSKIAVVSIFCNGFLNFLWILKVLCDVPCFCNLSVDPFIYSHNTFLVIASLVSIIRRSNTKNNYIFRNISFLHFRSFLPTSVQERKQRRVFKKQLVLCF